MLSPRPLPVVWQKRGFDILVSIILIIITAPVFILSLILIFLEHLLRGFPADPLFYRDERVSRNKAFFLYKFNIFDQRVIDSLRRRNEFIHTKELEWNGDTIYVGKVLRQTYLDELPQLFNVLKGDMSLVGPRPLNKQVYAKANSSGSHPLSYIQGGMTGNFQSVKDVSGCDAATMDAEYLEKYVKGSSWSLVFFDIKIILRTIGVLLSAKGI